MAYEQEYESGRGLPVRVGSTDMTLSGARTSGTNGTGEPISGLWPQRRGFPLAAYRQWLTAHRRQVLICAASALCLLAVCAFLMVRGLTGRAGRDGGDRLPGAVDLTDTAGTVDVPDMTKEPERGAEPSAPMEPRTGNETDAVSEPVTRTEASEADGTLRADGTQTQAGAREAEAESGATETDAAFVTEPASDAGTESGAEPGTEPETQPPVPVAGEGAVLRDMSESERGPDYLINDTDRDPAAVPAWVPDGTKKPVVLLVCSRPYDGYADGDGGGVVSDLAETLAAELRRRGVTVIFVNRALTGLTKDSSVAACREKTQSLIRYYCRLYGDITLVMDVRRGAELVEGSLLATAGTADGQPGAQLRLIADGRRPGDEDGTAAADLDLSLAAAIRRGVYEVSPTAPRPVLWRDNAGLIPDGLCGEEDGPRLVTVELGSAGNTYSSAAALIPLLARSTAAALGQ